MTEQCSTAPPLQRGSGLVCWLEALPGDRSYDPPELPTERDGGGGTCSVWRFRCAPSVGWAGSARYRVKALACSQKQGGTAGRGSRP